MSLVTRYSDRIYGDITFIGNTLGVSRGRIIQQDPIPSPGTFGIVGAFITTDKTKTCGWFGSGTTCDYLLNKSTALLQLPASTNILYAELIWGGTSSTDGGDISHLLDDKIIFKGPNEHEIEVEPEDCTKSNEVLVADSQVKVYTRSAIVTNYVKSAGNGVYYAGRIPAYLDWDDNTSYESGCVGWTLAVIYEYETRSMPFKSISLYVGGLAVQQNLPPSQIPITNFVTPDLDDTTPELLLSAAEGDYNLTGENVYLGSEGNPLMNTPLCGPNNPVNNFFASQINGNDGYLVTTGTFGTINHIRNKETSQYIGVSGARQGWDITRVRATNHIDKNQNKATLKIETQGDSVLINGAAVVIDTQEPKLELTKQSHSTYVTIGSIVEYTVYVGNVGNATAERVLLTDCIPVGMSFVSGTVKVNQEVKPELRIEDGVFLGDITTSQHPIQVDFQLRVDSIDGITEYRDYATVEYHYSLQNHTYCVKSNEQVCYLRRPEIGLEKIASKSGINVGEGKEEEEERTVHYRLVVKNTGDMDLIDTKVVDVLPEGMNMVGDTLTVIPPIGGEIDLEQGITIDLLKKGDMYMFDYDAKVPEVTTTPCEGDFVSEAIATGHYKLNSNDIMCRAVTRKDNATVHCIKSIFDKVADKINVQVGEFVTYTLTVTNHSSVDFMKVVLYDVVSQSLEFTSSVPEGVTRENLASGYEMGDLVKGGTKTIQYTVKVTDGEGLHNEGYAKVCFKGTCGDTTYVTTETKPWTLHCIHPSILLEKSVDKCYVTEEETVREYTVKVTNNGDVLITALTFEDDLAGGTYVDNSTYYFVNGNEDAKNPFGHDPSHHEVKIPDLAPGDYCMIRYSVNLGR